MSAKHSPNEPHPTNPLLRIGLTGSSGRMETAIAHIARDSIDVDLAWAIESEKEPAAFSKRDFEKRLMGKLKDAPVGVLIDFSSPERTLSALACAVEMKTPMLIGTTGFSTAELDAIDEAARKIPIFLESNMSPGIHMVARLLKMLHPLVRDDYDFELIETHHNQKQDAPSGTALRLLDTWADLEKKPRSEIVDLDRTTKGGKRTQGRVGVHSVRAGDIVGVHTLLFAGDAEVIKIEHQALDRRLFAYGALRATRWLCKQPAGRYRMGDLLNSQSR